jgi:integrase
MNDIVINWKKLGKGIPQGKQSAEDRIPTMDEIHKLIEHPDRRVKIIVYVMISSGIRVGSWDFLKWKHVIPIKKKNTLVAAKLIVRNTKINNREYYTFITPEAYNALKDYMDFRQLHGEKISPESFLIRDTWQKIDRNHGHRIGLAKFPKKINSVSIRNMIYEAWHVQGVRNKLHGTENKRHEFKSTHGFRKVFETRSQIAKMNHNNIKLLMDHSLGESQNYHRPIQDELLQDYLQAVDFLTINDENKLKKKILELTEQQDEMDLMKLKHEKEMQAMDLKLNKILSVIHENPKLAKVKTEVLKRTVNIE